MTGSFQVPGALLAAQAASFSKGQDVTQDQSKEKLEKDRQLRQQLVQAKAMEAQKKAGQAGKGILA